MQAIEIFKTGTHTAMSGERLSFGEAELAAAAGAYDPALHEAPIVVGHPAADAPAYGWVRSLAFAEGALSATPDQVDPAFAELVKAGRFKKVSASFYRPGAANNPRPEVYYLRHVGFLGAQPPAVKGLKPAAFAEGEDGVIVFGDFQDRVVARLFRAFREWLIDEKGLETADRVLPSFEVDLLQEEAAQPEPMAKAPAFAETVNDPQPKKKDPSMTEPKKTPAAPAETDEQRQARETREAEFAERETRHKEAVTAFRRQQADAFVERLVEVGRVPPGHKDGLAAFMAQLDDEGDVVAFGEGDAAKKQTMRGYFEAFLTGLPKQIAFGEIGGGDGGEVNAADPNALAEAAVAYQEEMRAKGIVVSTDRAVRHVAKGV